MPVLTAQDLKVRCWEWSGTGGVGEARLIISDAARLVLVLEARLPGCASAYTVCALPADRSGEPSEGRVSPCGHPIRRARPALRSREAARQAPHMMVDMPEVDRVAPLQEDTPGDRCIHAGFACYSYLLFSLFQIINHSKNFGETKFFKFG